MKMRNKYESIEEVRNDLKILNLERKIALEKIKLLSKSTNKGSTSYFKLMRGLFPYNFFDILKTALVLKNLFKKS